MDERILPDDYKHIKFTRSSVAKILGISTQTIANREKRGVYRPAQRGENKYRYYNLHDVFKLQEDNEGQYYVGPILVVLWDLGYRDASVCKAVLDDAIRDFELGQTINT